MRPNSRVRPFYPDPSHQNQDRQDNSNDRKRERMWAPFGRCHCLCFLSGLVVTIFFLVSVIVPLVVIIFSTSVTKTSSPSILTTLSSNTSMINGFNTSSIVTTMTVSTNSITSTATLATTTASTAMSTISTNSATATTTTAYNCASTKSTSLASPSGNVNTTWIQFIGTYTANKTNPLLIFGFDAASGIYVALDDVSVTDTANPSVQLLNNPSFENSSSTATGWTTWCTSSCGSNSEGNVTTNSCRTGKCFVSGCNGGGTDYIGQVFPAIIGRAYNISFWSQRVRFGAIGSAATLYAGII